MVIINRADVSILWCSHHSPISICGYAPWRRNLNLPTELSRIQNVVNPSKNMSSVSLCFVIAIFLDSRHVFIPSSQDWFTSTRTIAWLPQVLLQQSWTMMTSSNGNIFRVTGPLCGEFTGPGEFPAQRPVTRSFDVFVDLRLNKRLSKQPWGWWFEAPSWSLWRQCNGYRQWHVKFYVRDCFGWLFGEHIILTVEHLL